MPTDQPRRKSARCPSCGRFVAYDAERDAWWCERDERTVPPPPREKWRTNYRLPLAERIERWQGIRKMRAEGKTWDQIGEAYGIRKQRAKFIHDSPEPFGPPGLTHRWEEPDGVAVP